MSRTALVAEVTVASAERLSPSFVRVELAGSELADFGVEGPLYDQRIKLVLPGADGTTPELPVERQHWYEQWRRLPADTRGHLRTYTVRAVRGAGEGTRLVVDFAVHLAAGRTGPASQWASRATVGDRLLLIGPRRGHLWGGIEFTPGTASWILLAGDETALPAISRILADLPGDTRGDAFIEVPVAGDVLDLPRPAGIRLHWFPRGGRAHGESLVAAVTAYLGGPSSCTGGGCEGEIDPMIWETPTWSSSAGGEVVAQPGRGAPGSGLTGRPGLYAWVAGEAASVTRLRRHLVGGCGVDRRQVAFMGYWREGVAASG